MPVLSRTISEALTVACWFTPLKPGQEGRDEVEPRQVRRREVRNARAERRIDRVAEQDVDERGQRRVRHIGRELRVHARLACVEGVLVGQADHDLVDQRVRKPGYLHPAAGTGFSTRVADRRVRDPRLLHRGRGPAADHAVAAAHQALLRQFERNRRDVLVGDDVVRRVLLDAARKCTAVDRDDIDQVEDPSEVHREGLVALADEHASRHRAAGNRDVLDERARVFLVTRHAAEGFRADEVVGLAEYGRTIARAPDGGRSAAAPVAADQSHRVRLAEVQERLVGRRHRADVLERHRDGLAADVERKAPVRVAEAIVEPELERQVLARIAVVVDVDLVERAGVEGEVIGTAIGILQRQVVREHGHVAGTARLVTVEEVEVGRIHGGHAGDVRRLAVAGRLADGCGERRGHCHGDFSILAVSFGFSWLGWSALCLSENEIRRRWQRGCSEPLRRHPPARSLRILLEMATTAQPGAESEIAGFLARCARQDRQAFQRLYERTAPQLLGCLLRILRNRAMAEDALQDVFVQVWNRAGQFDSSRGSAWAWLIAIARYRAIDVRRREGRMTAETGRDLDDIPDDTEPPEAVAFDLGDRTARALAHCLEALQPRQRECIVLAYQGGLSHSEVATEVGEPLGSVKSWIRRGLAALKRCLES